MERHRRRSSTPSRKEEPREEEDVTPTPPRRSCRTPPPPRELHRVGAQYDDNDIRVLPAWHQLSTAMNHPRDACSLVTPER